MSSDALYILFYLLYISSDAKNVGAVLMPNARLRSAWHSLVDDFTA